MGYSLGGINWDATFIGKMKSVSGGDSRIVIIKIPYRRSSRRTRTRCIHLSNNNFYSLRKCNRYKFP